MPKYSTIMRVLPRMEAVFTKEQIEGAAKVLFYLYPPEECEVNTAPQDLDLSWSDDYLREEKAIRVVGDVEEPDAS
jgi:hypothetical protein